MDNHIQELITIFQELGFALPDKNKLKGIIKGQNSQRGFDWFEGKILRKLAGNGQGLLVTDTEKLVTGMNEMTEEEKTLFCLFGTATLHYMELSDQFTVGTGSVENIYKKMITEINNKSFNLDSFLPEGNAREIKLKLIFNDQKQLIKIAGKVRDKIYTLSKIISHSEKIIDSREKVREIIESIYEEKLAEIIRT